MDEGELVRQIAELKALAKDNHRMLRAIRREAWAGFAAKLLFWAVIILGPLYFLYPYLGELPTVAEFQQLMQVYQHGQL